ncbi:CBASS cGAMP synthase [Acinetobacter sp. ANC 5383]
MNTSINFLEQHHSSLNLHQIFFSSPKCLYNQLCLKREQVATLEKCKDIIFSTLKQTVAEALEKNYNIEIEPILRLQGSMAYGTCIQPMRPEQEIDLDLGIYLPAKVFFDINDHKAAHKLFSLVQDALTELSSKNQWKIKKMPKCLRVEIGEQVHIDVPLYVAPFEMFNQLEDYTEITVLKRSEVLKKSVGLESYAAFDSAEPQEFLMESLNFAMASMQEVERHTLRSITTANLATIDEHGHGKWIESDVDKINQWFVDAVKNASTKNPPILLPQNDLTRFNLSVEAGKQLLGVIAFLKAWSKYLKDDDGPSSICLMVLATDHFSYHHKRIDLALLHVLKQLPEALLNDVQIDELYPESPNFNPENYKKPRKVLAGYAKKFLDDLISALNSQQHATAFRLLRTYFGEMLPTDLTLVKDVTSSKSTAAQVVTRPSVSQERSYPTPPDRRGAG